MPRILIGAAASLVVLIGGVGVYILLLLAEPYDARPIPTQCTTNLSHLPDDRTFDVPSVGRGTIVTADGPTLVVITANYRQTPFVAHVYVVNRTASRIVRSFDFPNDVVAASVRDGVVYLFNDKIGYFFDASTGARLESVIESDNYRGIYADGRQHYVQTSFSYNAIGPGLNVVFNRELRMGAIAYGCVIA